MRNRDVPWNAKYTAIPNVVLTNPHRRRHYHGTEDELKTICGKVIRDSWTKGRFEQYEGEVTCPSCIRLLKREYHKSLKEGMSNAPS